MAGGGQNSQNQDATNMHSMWLRGSMPKFPQGRRHGPQCSGLCEFSYQWRDPQDHSQHSTRYVQDGSNYGGK